MSGYICAVLLRRPWAATVTHRMAWYCWYLPPTSTTLFPCLLLPAFQTTGKYVPSYQSIYVLPFLLFQSLYGKPAFCKQRTPWGFLADHSIDCKLHVPVSIYVYICEFVKIVIPDCPRESCGQEGSFQLQSVRSFQLGSWQVGFGPGYTHADSTRIYPHSL